MRKTLLAAALATFSIAAFVPTTQAQMREAVEVPAGSLDQADVDFLHTADAANIDQMTFGNRMAGNVKSRMRSLGENVSRSHRKADEALRLLAAAKHVDLDHAMSSRAKDEAAELTRPDPAVDRMYAQNVVRDMNDLIMLYSRVRDTTRDGDIRSYAEKMLPALESSRHDAEDALKRYGES